MPRTVTIDHKIFNFHELSTDVQDRLAREESEFQSENWDSECTMDHWRGLLEDTGFPDAKISYSGFDLPGEGASFTCPNVDIGTLLAFLKTGASVVNAGYDPRKLDVSQFDLVALDWLVAFEVQNETGFRLHQPENRYRHEHMILVEVNGRNSGPAIWEQCEILGASIQDLARDLSRMIFSELKEDYESTTSEANCRIILKEMENEYYVDGEIYNSMT